MIEVGDGAGFGQIGFGITRLSNQPSMGHLDRHGPLQLLVVSEVDEAEAAFAEDFLHQVATNLLRRCLWIMIIHRRFRVIRGWTNGCLGVVHGQSRSWAEFQGCVPGDMIAVACRVCQDKIASRTHGHQQ